MNKLLSLALAAALCAPAFAQVSGMINQGAPTMSQTLTAGGAKIQLDYTSIAWGRGEMFTKAMDKADGADARKGINELSKKKPIGSFSTSVDVTIGTLKIPAGEYKIGFTITENLDWEINFMGKETLTMKLPLMDNKEMPHKRLLCSLFAGDDKGAGVYIAFGEKWCILNVAPGGGGGGKG
jgi:hypothetical protein